MQMMDEKIVISIPDGKLDDEMQMCIDNHTGCWQKEWSSLTYEEKSRLLFLRQKATLDMFLERGAISQAQYDKSLHDLIKKMGMQDN